MRLVFSPVVALAAVLVVALPTLAADPLAEKIQAVITGKDYTQAHWGLLVVDAKTGETVYAHNAEKLFAPASVTKLYSCAAALVAYGADYRFDTPVYRRGDVSKKGVLRGDLILVASGDPSFGGRSLPDGRLAFEDGDHTYANGGSDDTRLTDTDPLAALTELAKQIKKDGIREITGEVLIDDRLFFRALGTGSGPDSVTPIMVNDNVVDLTITPGAKVGDPCTVSMRPETARFVLDASVQTVDKDKKPTITLNATVHSISVRGSLPVGGKPAIRIVPVDEPAQYARTLFIEALRKQGIRVNANLIHANGATLPEKDAYKSLPRVAVYTSAPMSELIKVILKVSHNLYASTLPCLLAAKKGEQTLSAGLKEEGRILKSLGVDISTISFGGGAGGSNADMVTPRATVTLLQAMRKRPEWAAYHAGLPVLGVDGTLASIVKSSSPAKGKVYAKTGTYYWHDSLNGRSLLTSKALAGVITTNSGRDLTFAFFVNDVPLPAGTPTSREGKVLGRLAEIVCETVK